MCIIIFMNTEPTVLTCGRLTIHWLSFGRMAFSFNGKTIHNLQCDFDKRQSRIRCNNGKSFCTASLISMPNKITCFKNNKNSLQANKFLKYISSPIWSYLRKYFGWDQIQYKLFSLSLFYGRCEHEDGADGAEEEEENSVPNGLTLFCTFSIFWVSCHKSNSIAKRCYYMAKTAHFSLCANVLLTNEV